MSGVEIHPSAIVEDGAELGTNVKIGPFCHISGDAVIGDGSPRTTNLTLIQRSRLSTVAQPLVLFQSVSHGPAWLMAAVPCIGGAAYKRQARKAAFTRLRLPSCTSKSRIDKRKRDAYAAPCAGLSLA